LEQIASVFVIYSVFADFVVVHCEAYFCLNRFGHRWKRGFFSAVIAVWAVLLYRYARSISSLKGVLLSEKISSAEAVVRLSLLKISVKIALSKASRPRILFPLFFTLSFSGFALFGQSWVLRLNAFGCIALFPGRYVILKLEPARNFDYRTYL
jgi:hypothetical protein